MTQDVLVERMGYGAEAVARLTDGKTAFIEGAVTGDECAIELTEQRKAFDRARMAKLLRPSPFRVPPVCAWGAYQAACPKQPRCGGCPWQELDYEAQLAAKRDNVVARLTRNGGFEVSHAETLVRPCLGSKRRWGFRNKIELAGAYRPESGFQLGFSGAASHDIVMVDRCEAAVAPMQSAPKALRGALRYLQKSENLDIFRVGVRASLRTKALEIALWTKPGAFPRAACATLLQSALKASSIVRVLAEPGKERKVKRVEVLAGDGFWTERMGEAVFQVSAPSFFQVNTAQAEVLVAQVLGFLGATESSDTSAAGNFLDGLFIADLYAGCGTFSIPLARAGAEVVAVESCGPAVRDLRRNAERNHVEIEVIGGDAARELPALGALDALVVDPPRAGLADGVVNDIASARPGRVVYVSCDAATWARDARRFDEAGYALRVVQPVDLFPQTHHVEVASLFERRGRS